MPVSVDDFADDRAGRSATAPDPEFAKLQEEIAATRERVALTVQALEREINRAIDWRDWIRRHPGRVLAGAFAVGWFFGRRG